MPRISAAFFLFGIFSLLVGMLLGMHMGAKEDMTLAAAHAHINLVGWATMALYGTFYTLTRHSKLLWLPRINFVLSTLGTIVSVDNGSGGLVADGNNLITVRARPCGIGAPGWVALSPVAL